MAPAAAEYPDRGIRILVPYPAGGPNDILARMLGDKLTQSFGKQTIIENRPGAGGNIAVDAAARAEPDGYTAVLPAMAYAVNPYLYARVPYKFESLKAVSIVASGPLVLVVTPSLGVSSVQDLIKLAKEKPGALSYASGGNGSSLHLAAEMFKREAGVDMVHVPYKGTNDLIADLLTGRVPLAFLSPLNARELVKDGRLKALAVTTSQRSPGWDEVPTVAEQGLPGFNVEGWYAVLVPAGSPPATIETLNHALKQALESPDIGNRLRSLGIQPVGTTPDDAEAFLKSERAKWQKLVEDAKLKAD
ncbi:Bug family tripartite tricarboxylate transporter substrate binding protein [Enterovirga rhinocerotis]|uniref:Bug family tripartite tricarboxylate transporter substrate binding protein n=1 Tax=Enterovirga rhinocerotis TaxID=1339210 RepID=UPI001414E4C5|nr:tripartite tricarboxylate transporter substrate binding protein [Enterovirga rhinocerotis]